MVDAASANNAQLVSREQWGNTVGAALRLYVGRGRRYSVKQLSNATGVKDRVIECAMCRSDSLDYRPLPGESLASIGQFLGADFTNEWIGLMMQGAFDLPEEEPDPGKLAAAACDDTAKVVHMAIDGDLKNDSPQELRTTGARMMTHGAQLVAVASGRRAVG